MTTPAKQPPTYRPSFTLVELLVAISIIGLMAGMLLYSLLGAQTDARVARTRGTLQKINEIVLQKWEEYRYKPVNIQLPPEATTPIPGVSPPQFPVSPREQARLRMVILRDTMRMEMPDRITDLIYFPSQYTVVYRAAPPPALPLATKLDRVLPHSFGLIYNALRSRIIALKSQNHPSWATGYDLSVLPSIPFPATTPVGRFTSDSDANWHNAVQSSELLYLLIASSQYSGGSALELFRPSEVGDPDGDGLLEFIDAWGNPIHWIRWPAGYPGDLVRYADDDAMDPLKTDWRYRPGVPSDWKPRTLVPLIISAGADEEYGVTFDYDNPIVYATMTWPAGPAPNGTDNGVHYSVSPYYYPDPFFTWDYNNGVPNGAAREAPFADGHPSGRGYRANQLGSVPIYVDAAQTIPNTFAVDNVTNHDVILEP